jgi:hypothetical protein
VIPSKEDKLRSVLATLTGTRAEGLLRFHDDHISEILSARGSSGGNHQAWEGGLHDHLVHCFVLAKDLYKLFHERIGPGPHAGQHINGVHDPRPIPFSLESAIVVLYFHDIEKIFKYGNKPRRYPERLIEAKDAWYLGILPTKYGIVFDEQEYNALKYAHGEGDDHRKDQRVASPLAGFIHAIDYLSARVLWQIKDFDYGFEPILPTSASKLSPDPQSLENLHNLCRRATGRRVRYTGTNGDEFDKINHGSLVKGEGFCTAYHDSHGLCIIVKHDDDSEICVDPISVEILGV